jgi:ubiquinone/menaquinone biosynthesis C-methylase UbiE
MENSYSRRLHIWEGWARAVGRGLPLLPGGYHPGARVTAEQAQIHYADESLEPSMVGPPVQAGVEPYSLQWFLDIENQRHRGRGKWIPRLLEFARHSGETLLGLGNGLGTDWIQYARHGAAVVVCSSSAEQLALTRRNFELRGLEGRFLHTSAQSLPLENACIDVVCASTLLQESGDPEEMVEEIYRVLRPGGKVLAVASAHYDIRYWQDLCHPWRGGLRPCNRAGGRRWSARRLRQLFARFIEGRVYKRHLHRTEVPHLWRWLPMPLLERLFGGVLVLKAFKPLSAAISVRAAA